MLIPCVPGAAFKGIGPCEVSSGVGTQLAWLWKSCFGIDVYLASSAELGSNPGKPVRKELKRAALKSLNMKHMRACCQKTEVIAIPGLPDLRETL